VQVGQAADPKAPKIPVATLIVTPDDAQKLELAKNQGRISLSLRNPLDDTNGVDGLPVSTDVLDPTLTERLARERQRRNNGGDGRSYYDGERSAPVARAIPPPPPPSRIVEVFRGDKHVQEKFN
jgi:Flp pilus assembly protein CpaB